MFKKSRRFNDDQVEVWEADMLRRWRNLCHHVWRARVCAEAKVGKGVCGSPRPCADERAGLRAI
eukprot:6512336-Lingulodinium_polyedra.AAC.1